MNWDYKAFSNALLEWYDRHRRILPWREQKNPYYTWISEIMLQQTQVATVIPYFERFIEKLPTIEALSMVSEDELNKLWEGLGYYSRARNLKIAAQQVMSDFEGVLPESYDDLITLKGIGPYTAGAISSIAYGERQVAIDGNVMRIFSRLLCDDFPVNQASARKHFTPYVEAVIPAHRPGDFNQALMDIGAQICVPKGKIACSSCPLKDFCEAEKRGNPAEFPKKQSKKSRKKIQKTILRIKWENKYYIEKRPEQGLLANLWEFKNLEGWLSEAEIFDYVSKHFGDCSKIVFLGETKHIFSHLEWHMKGYCVIVSISKFKNKGRWVSCEELVKTYALPGALQYYIPKNKMI